MKTLNLIIVALLFSLPALCTNPVLSNSPNEEMGETLETITTEVESRFRIVTDEKDELTIKSLSEKIKVVILNDEFRKVRVDYVDKIEDIYNQSTLLPLINRSEFISKIYNVSYFMLRN